MTTIYYTKQGRRYVPAANGRPLHYDSDVMKVGMSRLETVVGSGERTYQYGIRPDFAPVAAALALLRHGLISQIEAAAIGTPWCNSEQYTTEQLEILEEFRAKMAAAGGLLPSWWTKQSPADIATAVSDLIADRIKAEQAA